MGGGGGLYYVFSSESLYGQAKAGIEPRTSTIIRLKDKERLKLAPFSTAFQLHCEIKDPEFNDI